MSLDHLSTQPLGQRKHTESVLRLAIVGLGLVGCRHADAIAQCGDIELCAIVDPSETAKAKAASLAVACFDDLPSMIMAKRPDGIIISTPTKHHAAQAMQAIEAGIPALVEKPITDDLATAQSLVEASEALRVPLMVGHHRRFNPIIRKAKSIVTSDSIGMVRAIHATCWFYKPDSYFDTAPWRKRLGAGPVSVNLVHDIDLMRYLCGEITHIQAQASQSTRGYENEDVAAALFRFDNGAIGTVTVSDSVVAPWSWEFTAQEYPIYPHVAESTYQIGGSKGALSVPDLKLWHHDQKPDWWSPISAKTITSDREDPLVSQIRHFADVIHGTDTPLVSGREGLRTLSVIDAIQIAAQTGQMIQLTDSDGIIKLDTASGDFEIRTHLKPNLTKPAI